MSLFALVTQLRFNLSCLASIFFLAAQLVVAQVRSSDATRLV